MIVRKPFRIRDCMVYAYNGKPGTCLWCGFKLQKLWYYQDYKCVGSKQVKPGLKLIREHGYSESAIPETVDRPVWEVKPDATDRGRGMPIDTEAMKIGGPTCIEPMGCNSFCSMSCATIWALAMAALGCKPEPIVGSQVKIRALFRAPPYNCDYLYHKYGGGKKKRKSVQGAIATSAPMTAPMPVAVTPVATAND